jgi:hypothetical protein
LGQQTPARYVRCLPRVACRSRRAGHSLGDCRLLRDEALCVGGFTVPGMTHCVMNGPSCGSDLCIFQGRRIGSTCAQSYGGQWHSDLECDPRFSCIGGLPIGPAFHGSLREVNATGSRSSGLGSSPTGSSSSVADWIAQLPARKCCAQLRLFNCGSRGERS